MSSFEKIQEYQMILHMIFDTISIRSSNFCQHKERAKCKRFDSTFFRLSYTTAVIAYLQKLQPDSALQIFAQQNQKNALFQLHMARKLGKSDRSSLKVYFNISDLLIHLHRLCKKRNCSASFFNKILWVFQSK